MLGKYSTIIFSYQKAPKSSGEFLSACKAHAEVWALAMAFLWIVLAMQIVPVAWNWFTLDDISDYFE